MIYGLFIVELKKDMTGMYPSQQEVKRWVDSFGWKLVATEKDKSLSFEPYANAGEIIYSGVVGNLNVQFMVTQKIESQISFYIFSENVFKIQKALEKVIKKVLNVSFNGGYGISISENSVALLNVDTHTIELEGRVVSNVFKEAILNNRKDHVLLIMAILLVLISGASLANQNKILQDLFVAGLSTAIVSMVGIIQTYLETYIDLRYGHIVAWNQK